MARSKRRTHGEGTVYEKRPGYWSAQIRYAGQRLTASGPTADAARRSLAAKLDEVDETRRPRAAADWTVGRFLTEWKNDLRATEALKASTWHRYDALVRCYLIPGLGSIRLVDLSKQHVAHLIRDIRAGQITGRQGRRASETTLHHIHAVLRVALESAVEQELVNQNVARLLKAPSVRLRPKVILDKKQAARLIEAARTHPCGAAVILGIATGMREGEILALRRRDLKLDAGELLVSTNLQDGYTMQRELVDPKSEAGKRAIPLPKFATEALRDHLARQDPPSPFVFPGGSGKPLWRQGFLRWTFYPILRQAGLPQMPFHDLRHSAATLMMEMEVDAGTVSRILGHASPAITLQLYGHVTTSMKRRAADKVDQLLGNGRRSRSGANGSQMAAKRGTVRGRSRGKSLT